MDFTLYRKYDDNLPRPSLAIHIAFFILSFITINTYYLVFLEIEYRYYLWVALAAGYFTSIYFSYRYKIHIQLLVNFFALFFSIYYSLKIVESINNLGSMLGQLLAVLLVLRSYILFSKDDFRIPLVISLTLMLLCAIPSFESNFVISLQIYLIIVIVCLYLLAKYREIDETNIGSFETERFKKNLTLKSEVRILIFFALTAIISSTLLYLVLPHSKERKTIYTQQFRSILGARISYSDEGPAGIATRGDKSANPIIYPGFDENVFRITQGQVIREGPKANEVVMEVHANYPCYMRAMVWDVYNGHGWERSGSLDKSSYELDSKEEPKGNINIRRYDLGQAQKVAISTLKSNFVSYDGVVYLINQQIPSSFVFLPWQSTSLAFGFKGLWGNEAGEVRLNHPGSIQKRYLGGLKSYDFSSTTYFPSGMESTYLRDHPTGAFLKRYTVLPEGVNNPINGRNLKDLAEKIAFDANAKTDCEKTLAVLNYLRTVGKYSLSPPHIPPEFDTIAYFLLEVNPKRGHCEFFSSAMAVLLRLLDVPCRVATGYSPGEYMFTKNRYIIREKNAHAWVEVFYPETGWVSYDPTPANAWASVKDRFDEAIASVSAVINDLYVYDPQTFYNTRIDPLINKTAWSFDYIIIRMGKQTPEWIRLNLLLILLVFFSSLGIIIAAFRLRYVTETTLATAKRLSRSYYRGLIRQARAYGIKIHLGDTPYEVLTKVGDNFPESYDATRSFMDDFWLANFAPSYMSRDAIHRLKPKYIAMSKSLRRSRRRKKSAVDSPVK